MSKQTVFWASTITALVVGASIWASVAIPNRTHAVARQQVAEVLADAAPQADCDASSAAARSPYVDRVGVDRRTCTVSITFKSTAPVAVALRGVQLSLQPRRLHAPVAPDGHQHAAVAWRCDVRGGHGALQADFPKSCQFYTEDLLL